MTNMVKMFKYTVHTSSVPDESKLENLDSD